LAIHFPVPYQSKEKLKMADTIYQKIGGEAAVNAAVDMFYRKVLSDDHISGYFDNTDMDAQREKQKAFLTMVFGGPNEYTGKDLRTAHAKLVEQGMDDSHFDAVAGHLQDTLSELGVPADIAGEIMTVAAGTRSEVLNR
jgi:hemoglobin